MGLKSFFFPKDFKKQMMAGSYATSSYSLVGSTYMKEKKPNWWKFWSLMPIWGTFVFYREGKRLVDADKSGKLEKMVKSSVKKK
jgi:hypothetical protein